MIQINAVAGDGGRHVRRDRAFHQLGGKRGDAIKIVIAEAILHQEIAALHVAKIGKGGAQCRKEGREACLPLGRKPADARDSCCILSAGCERPGCCGTAQNPEKFPPPHGRPPGHAGYRFAAPILRPPALVAPKSIPALLYRPGTVPLTAQATLTKLLGPSG